MPLGTPETVDYSHPVGGTGSLSALGRRHEELEAGVRDEESANTPAGKEDYGAGKASE